VKQAIYVHHARILSWNQSVMFVKCLAQESNGTWKASITGAFNGARIYDWQASTNNESDIKRISCFPL